MIIVVELEDVIYEAYRREFGEDLDMSVLIAQSLREIMLLEATNRGQDASAEEISEQVLAAVKRILWKARKGRDHGDD